MLHPTPPHHLRPLLRPLARLRNYLHLLPDDPHISAVIEQYRPG
jgi:hypothetical protein